MPKIAKPTLFDKTYKQKNFQVTDNHVSQLDKEYLAEKNLLMYQNLQQTFSGEKIPTNIEINEFLNSISNSIEIQKSYGDLSDLGKTTVTDWNSLVKSFQSLFNEKNDGELIQGMIKSFNHANSINRLNKGFKKDDLNDLDNKTKKSYNDFLTIIKVIMSSPQGRSLLWELGSILEFFFGSLAETTGKELQKDSNKRYDATESNLNSTSKSKNKNKNTINSKKARNKSGYISPPRSHISSVKKNSFSKDNEYENEDLNYDSDHNHRNRDFDYDDYDEEDLSLSGKDYKEKMNQSMVKVWREKVPNNKKERIEERFYAAIHEIVGNPDYQKSIHRLINSFTKLFDSMISSSKKQKWNFKSNVEANEQHTYGVESLRLLLERLAGNLSMEELIDSIQEVKTCVLNDDELQEAVNIYGKFIKQTLTEPGFIMQEQWSDVHKECKDIILEIINNKYVPQRDKLFHNIRSFFTAIYKDPYNTKFRLELAKLLGDLFTDNDGNFTFKKDIYSDFVGIIIPSVFNQIKYIPLPSFQFDRKKYRFFISNVILGLPNVLPNICEFNLWNAISLGFRNRSTLNENKMTLGFYQVHIQANDVIWIAQKRKKNVYKEYDEGLCDFIIGGQGISSKLQLNLSPKDKSKAIEIDELLTTIDNLKIKPKGTRMTFIYKMMMPFLIPKLKRLIINGYNERIIKVVEKINNQLISRKDRQNKDLLNRKTKIERRMLGKTYKPTDSRKHFRLNDIEKEINLNKKKSISYDNPKYTSRPIIDVPLSKRDKDMDLKGSLSSSMNKDSSSFRPKTTIMSENKRKILDKRNNESLLVPPIVAFGEKPKISSNADHENKSNLLADYRKDTTSNKRSSLSRKDDDENSYISTSTESSVGKTKNVNGHQKIKKLKDDDEISYISTSTESSVGKTKYVNGRQKIKKLKDDDEISYVSTSTESSVGKTKNVNGHQKIKKLKDNGRRNDDDKGFIDAGYAGNPMLVPTGINLKDDDDFKDVNLNKKLNKRKSYNSNLTDEKRYPSMMMGNDNVPTLEEHRSSILNDPSVEKSNINDHKKDVASWDLDDDELRLDDNMVNNNKESLTTSSSPTTAPVPKLTKSKMGSKNKKQGNPMLLRTVKSSDYNNNKLDKSKLGEAIVATTDYSDENMAATGA